MEYAAAHFSNKVDSRPKGFRQIGRPSRSGTFRTTRRGGNPDRRRRSSPIGDIFIKESWKIGIPAQGGIIDMPIAITTGRGQSKTAFNFSVPQDAG